MSSGYSGRIGIIFMWRKRGQTPLKTVNEVFSGVFAMCISFYRGARMAKTSRVAGG
jgi:hypothetical protein